MGVLTNIFAVIIITASSTSICNGQRGIWLRTGSEQFYISNGGVLEYYENAKKFCAENFGFLANIKTKKIQEFVEQQISQNLTHGATPFGFYIGLKKIGGTFTWSDGTQLNFSNWLDNTIGSDDCVIMGETNKNSTHLAWNVYFCQNHAGYICQRNLTGEWESWSNWGTCSSSCTFGVRIRNRECRKLDFSEGYSLCIGRANETQSCNEHLCESLNVNKTGCLGNGSFLQQCAPVPPSDGNFTDYENRTAMPVAASTFVTSAAFYAIISIACASLVVGAIIFAATYRKKYILRVTDPKIRKENQQKEAANNRMSTVEPTDVRLDGYENKIKIKAKYDEISLGEDNGGFSESINV